MVRRGSRGPRGGEEDAEVPDADPVATYLRTRACGGSSKLEATAQHASTPGLWPGWQTTGPTVRGRAIPAPEPLASTRLVPVLRRARDGAARLDAKPRQPTETIR